MTLFTINLRHGRRITYQLSRQWMSQIGVSWANPLHWRHNDHDGVSNHQPHHCLLRRRSKKTSKLGVTGLCVGNSPGPVNSPHKGPATRKMFPFDDVTMHQSNHLCTDSLRISHLTAPIFYMSLISTHRLVFQCNIISPSEIFPRYQQESNSWNS